jgi:hypothetical protein
MTTFKTHVAKVALTLIVGGLFVGDCKLDLGAGSPNKRHFDRAPDIVRGLVEQSHSHIELPEGFAYVSSAISATGGPGTTLNSWGSPRAFL